MVNVVKLTFNPFQENTYVLGNDEGECWIVDPGCSNEQEQEELRSLISSKKWTPKAVLLTHAHIDHVMGCAWVSRTYGLSPWMNELEIPVLQAVSRVGSMYGVHVEESPEAERFLQEGELIKLGNEEFSLIFCPGHSPGSLCFYHAKQKFLIGGDVLFRDSIGRTDLPGGNHELLISSIREKIFTLPEDVEVFPGHGPSTKIGWEKMHNPWF
jgi:hydroxyacylglutathione hydrolase